MKKKEQPAAAQQQQKLKREPRNIKDYLPSNLLNVRKFNPLKIPTNQENLPARNCTLSFEPIKLFPEWPSDEEIIVQFFFFNSGIQFFYKTR